MKYSCVTHDFAMFRRFMQSSCVLCNMHVLYPIFMCYMQYSCVICNINVLYAILMRYMQYSCIKCYMFVLYAILMCYMYMQYSCVICNNKNDKTVGKQKQYNVRVQNLNRKNIQKNKLLGVSHLHKNIHFCQCSMISFNNFKTGSISDLTICY